MKNIPSYTILKRRLTNFIYLLLTSMWGIMIHVSNKKRQEVMTVYKQQDLTYDWKEIGSFLAVSGFVTLLIAFII